MHSFALPSRAKRSVAMQTTGRGLDSLGNPIHCPGLTIWRVPGLYF